MREPVRNPNASYGSVGKRSELEVLRSVLGRGPANLLAFLIFSAWSVGEHKRWWKIGKNSCPITDRRICSSSDGVYGLGCRMEDFREWRSKLIEEGLLCVTLGPGKNPGYIYWLLGMENLPTMQIVDEYLEELREKDRAKYGSCERCGSARTRLWDERGRSYVACPYTECQHQAVPS